MKNIIILIFLLFSISKYSMARQTASKTKAQIMPFSTIIVKKNINGKICDSCDVDFAFTAVPDFTYLITGTRHTPNRLARQRFEARYRTNQAHADSYLISSGHVGITFLPNYLLENGKRVQVWRNFGGIAYDHLEFQVRQNKSIIQNWKSLLSLKEDHTYKILGNRGQEATAFWRGARHAGNFDLMVNDSLFVTVRNVGTKEIVKTIAIYRPIDKANNFFYYQIPLSNDQLGDNLQNILNLRNNSFKVYRGDTSKVFEKDYNAIGVLRFAELHENEEIEYVFSNDKPFRWRSVKTKDPTTGIFLILPIDMPDGENHNVFLRYKSQPETIYSIMIKVKKRPFQFPWLGLMIGFTLILTTGVIFFYLRERRNKMRLLALDRKNNETESQLALLSGQLNPHFLFNTLNAIQGTINSNNPDRANVYIGNVARFMRDVMDKGQKEFVSLTEALEMEEDYLQLEQQRIPFNYSIVISSELEPSQIDFPPLLLQPVLENSIRHAFSADLIAPLLSLNIKRLDRDLIVEVIDNGSSAWDTEHTSTGHGLSLTRKRISVYNEKLQYISILMNTVYNAGTGTMTTFTFQNWLA